MTNTTPERVNILNEAADLIVGQRQEDYGTPEENFGRMAELVNIHIRKNLETNTPLSPRQIAELMILLKISRTINSPTRDSYVDIGGYAGIAGELAYRESLPKGEIVDGEMSLSMIRAESVSTSKLSDVEVERLTKAKLAHPSNGVG